MPAAAAAPPLDALRVQLRGIRDSIHQARAERAEALSRRDSAREAVARMNTPPSELVRTEEFRAAERAQEQLSACDDRLIDLQNAERGVLALLGESPGGNGNGHHDHRVATQRLVSEPGRWLSTVLSRRKRDVPGLDDALRFTLAATMSDVSTVEESAALIDLLTPRSVAMASGIGVVRIDSTETRVPRFTSRPTAGWVPELAPFPKDAPGLEMVPVKPPKVGLVSGLSLEVFEDLSGVALAGVQTQLLRAVALALDAGILFGDGTGASPRGVANTTGIGAVTGVPLTSLAGFAEAIGIIITENAQAAALVMNPSDFGQLLGVTEESGSVVPLWKSAVSGADGLRLPYFDTPLWLTPACPAGTALLYDPATVTAIVRKDAQLDVDPYYNLDIGEIGLRVYVRASVLVGQPEGSVRMTFAAPAP
jgi:HK97 family phage major capsid protein